MVKSALLLLGIAYFNRASSQFVHPGVLISGKQLDFVKAQVVAGNQPFKDAFDKAQKSKLAGLNYQIEGPPSDGVITCGSYSNPNIGCSDEDDDASAAYVQALMFYLTGTQTYAANSIKIMNHYASRLHNYNDSNAPLQAGWGSEKWPRAAELIKHTPGAGWNATDITAFTRMLYDVVLPHIVAGSGANGNWELSMIEAMFGIAVFSDNQTLFNHAVTFWKQRIPAYWYYFPIDGDKPVPPPRGSPTWYGETIFNASVNGLCQETCRDLGHTSYGLAATFASAETAYIQGTDLYGPEQPRLTAALEFHANLLLGAAPPSYLCGTGKISMHQAPTFEIAYNHYHNRLGVNLPLSLQHITKDVRTMANPVDEHMMLYETLTHGGNAPY